MPDFIDHRDGNSLAAALRHALEEAAGDDQAQMRIATAYFTPSGFGTIADPLSAIPKVRMLFGAEDIRVPDRQQGTPGASESRRRQEGVSRELRRLEEGLHLSMDRLPFVPVHRAMLRRMLSMLESGQMELRRYEQGFMHAKAYILSAAKQKLYVGSANMTRAGMETNLELSLGVEAQPTQEQAEEWFDWLWEQSVPYDLQEWLHQLLHPWDPWIIYLRVLWKLYGSELEEEPQEAEGVRRLGLTNFQIHAVVRATRLIREYGGALVADEVGLGKTFIAAALLQIYRQNRQRGLIICPATLRDSTWRQFATEQQMFLECLSYEQLAQDVQIRAEMGLEGGSENLRASLEQYQLVIVDEAHNYRNPAAPTRAAVLRRLLAGQQRHLLLLTATPVNNSLWDLHQLLSYFLRQDSALAGQGIRSLRDIFREAEKRDPADLNPDFLYPVIDATTVKRTRRFIQRHYADDRILVDGQEVRIHFPRPVPRTIRYDIDQNLSGLFDVLEAALSGSTPNTGEGPARQHLLFARYTPNLYLLPEYRDPEEQGRMYGLSGLLGSGLLKRFESSVEAFRSTLGRMVASHEEFLGNLGGGAVATNEYAQEFAGDDEAAMEAAMEQDTTYPSERYRVDALRADVERDLEILRDLKARASEIGGGPDAKLRTLADELSSIAREAEAAATSDQDARNKRKVLVFSYFEDTLVWVRNYLQGQLQEREDLAGYRDRMVMVSGGGSGDVSRKAAAEGFAPESMGVADRVEDRYDLMLTTDILAEGVNLQQCRHIINYDLPWNPMRLVQRHGRIDRVRSSHRRVYLRTIFPAERLDDMLSLQEKIHRKLTQAARTMGVPEVIEDEESAGRVFTEGRREIERLLEEDPSLYEQGGTASAAQTGEEYRQTLRLAMEDGRLAKLPWSIGSGMARGGRRGVMFCAVVARDAKHERTYLRFVPTDGDWKPAEGEELEREVAYCLRMLECERSESLHLAACPPEEALYDLWEVARQDVYRAWAWETDPANLQPQLPNSHHDAKEFLRAHPPEGVNQERLDRAQAILDSAWSRNQDLELRQWLNSDERAGREKAAWLVERILETGLEPAEYRDPLPQIRPEDIHLLCWMGFVPGESSTGG